MNDNNRQQEIAGEDHPAKQVGDGKPKFGRLLIVLVLIVILIGFITFASEWLYT